jgi:hypothetical protein
MSLSLTYRNNDDCIIGRVAGVLRINELFGGNFPESVLDFGVLYGRAFGSDLVFLIPSVGLSFVQGTRRGAYLGPSQGGYFPTNAYEEIKYSAVGIPAQCQLFIVTPAPIFGFGLEVFGDLNKEVPFGGVLVSIQFGKLRN